MSKQPSVSEAGGEQIPASRDDLRHILGDVDDVKALEILSLNPSLTDLEEAGIWATGDGDVLAKSGRSLGTVAGAIVDILTADEEEPSA